MLSLFLSVCTAHALHMHAFDPSLCPRPPCYSPIPVGPETCLALFHAILLRSIAGRPSCDHSWASTDRLFVRTSFGRTQHCAVVLILSLRFAVSLYSSLSCILQCTWPSSVFCRQSQQTAGNCLLLRWCCALLQVETHARVCGCLDRPLGELLGLRMQATESYFFSHRKSPILLLFCCPTVSPKEFFLLRGYYGQQGMYLQAVQLAFLGVTRCC